MSPVRLWLYRVLTFLIPETSCFGLKTFLLRWAGAEIGENVRISTTSVILGAGRLVVGDDVWIGAGVFLSPVGDGSIEIGSHVDIAPRAMLFTGGA